MPAEELKPLVVTSIDTPVPAVLTPLRGESGVFRVPARGGARVLISIAWDPATVSQDGAVVLYGIASGARTPIAVAFMDADLATMTLPVFVVGGFPFENYEIDAITTSTGVTAGLRARAIGLVSASAGSESDVSVLGICRRPNSASALVGDVILAIANGWVSKIARVGLAAYRGVAVTPDDATDLARRPTDGIIVGTSGDVKVICASGDTVTYPALAAGVIHPIQATRVFLTDTTATLIKAVYGS